MIPYKLPLKFILLWVANIVILMVISFATGFHQTLLHAVRSSNVSWLYLAVGAGLAVLEQSLWDKLKGN